MTKRVLIGALATGLLISAVATLSAGGESSYRVRVELPDAAGLRSGSPVKVSGVSIGTVRKLSVTARDTSLAELEIGREDSPIGRDARLAVRPANLLGEKYIDLQVGDRAHPLASGGAIPTSATRTPVEIDDILDVLDPTTRTRLAILLREAGVALFGRGRDINTVLRTLPPTLSDARDLLAQATEDNRALEGILVHTGRVLNAAAAERKSLGMLVEHADTALSAVARRRGDLATSLARAPGTLAQLRATLRRLDSAGIALRPAANGLRATAPTLTSALVALPGFTRAALPALEAARRESPALTELGDEASPVVRRLAPTARELAGLGADSDALSRSLDEGAADLFTTMQNWALAIQDKDKVGHMFRLDAVASPELIKALAPFIAGEKRKKRSARRDAAPIKPAPAPQAATPRPSAHVPGVRKLPEPLPPAVTDTMGPATERAQELLDFLLKP